MLQPRYLMNGDRIAIVAPAGKLEKGSLVRAIDLLKSWNLEVIIGKNVFNDNNYFAGTDEERLSDLQNAINDPTISAILCARGGYGVTRILEKLQLNALTSSPKWLIGFSDITALHLKFLESGYSSIHGDLGTTLGSDKDSTDALYQLLFEGKSMLEGSDPFRGGMSKAQVTGGNLSLLVDSLGTSNELKSEGRILFIEEIGEKTYRIDRMMNQLLRAGKLNHLAGLVIGHFTDITDGSTPFGQTWEDAIKDIIKDFDYPVAFGYKIGHEPENYPIIHGYEYQLVVDDKISTLILG